MKELYIVDFEKLGNVVRFALGTQEQMNEACGDDWNDAPYDCNAGSVYPEYVSAYVDIAFDSRYAVLEPADIGYNERNPWCKEDMKKNKVPMIVAKKMGDDEYRWEYDNFNVVMAGMDAIPFYYGLSYSTLGELYILPGYCTELRFEEIANDRL